MSESKIQRDLQVLGGAYGFRLFRNNNGAVTTADGRHVRFGLDNTSKKHNEFIKSSDLIGWKSVTITPDMVGKTVPIFASIEVKKPNSRTCPKRLAAQQRWVDSVIYAGGAAGILDNPEDIMHV